MAQEPELTPNQQALLAFLDKLATEPLTHEMLGSGYELLDLAADECRKQQPEIQQQQGGQN